MPLHLQAIPPITGTQLHLIITRITWDVYLTSGTIDLSCASSYTLSVLIRYNTERRWDGYNIEYSDNGGPWTRLGNVGSGTNWYNDTDVDGIANREDGWSGDNRAWRTATIPLPAALDNEANVKFRFHMGTDRSVIDDGVAFDDFVITTSSSLALMTYSSSTTTQNNTSNVASCASNQEIVGLEVVTANCGDPLLFTQVQLNMTGSTVTTDVSNIDVFYSGTSSAFSTGQLFGSVAPGGGTLTVNGNQLLSAGTNYFWIAYDMNGTTANVVDAQVTLITVDAVNQTPSVTNLAGNRTEVICPKPGGVSSNLQLWLKANAGVTGNTSVTAWTDQSGAGHDATASQGPELSTNSINFNPALDFVSAGSEYLQITNGILGIATHNDAWVYTVSKTDLDQQQTIFFEDVSGAGESFDVLTPWSNERTYFDFGVRTEGRINVLWGSNYGDYNMWTYGTSTRTATPNGTRKVIQRDGAVITSNNNNDNATGNNSNFYIGGGYRNGVGTTRSFDGKMAEVIVYFGVPSALEQEKVQSYLGVKYGITKNSADNGGTAGEDERDYFASNATVIWDYATNATYHNDVAGIGRDDDSSLDQQKSISINTDAIVIMDKTTAFGTDKDFLLWGNDNAATTTTTTGAHPDYDEIMSRIWKVDLTGTPGNVTVQIIYPNDGALGNYGLLVDDNTDFTTGATAYEATRISGDTITFTNVSFTDGYFFTLGVTQSAPGGVTSGLNLWLKANAGVTGTTSVSAWTDQSGAGHDATATQGPELANNSINFNPSLTFNGTDELMRTANEMPAITNQFSGFVVIEKASTAVGKNILAYQNTRWGQLWSYGESSGNNNFTIYSQTPAAWRWSDDGTHAINTDPQVLNADWITSGNLTHYANGTAAGSWLEGSNITGLPANSRVIIGARGRNGSGVTFDEHFDGEIGRSGILQYLTFHSRSKQGALLPGH